VSLHRQLADEVLAWAEKVAGGPLSVEIAETEPHLAAALERRRYARARLTLPALALDDRVSYVHVHE
jgi:hypothetical protein